MELKYTFDEEVLNYEKRRPNYGTEIYKDIMEYGKITKGKSLLEIGCGTGQATEPFLKANCKVTAVELGENLASYTREKFKAYDNFNVIQGAFEDYDCEENKFDMLYSATAFHWIPEEYGYKKAYNIIKSCGTIALFWNKPSPNHEDNPVHEKIQAIYKELLPQWSIEASNNQDKPRYSSISKIEEYGFINAEFKLYHNMRKMTGVEYIELLNTYSNHIALEEPLKSQLFQRIKSAIEESGDEIIIKDTVELFLAQKPERS